MAELVLPPSVLTRVDASRLATELDEIDNDLNSAALRNTQQTPVLSDQLEDFLKINELSINDTMSRGEIIKQLQALKQKVPVMHMTFSVTADRESLGRVVAWLRESVHPQAVIHVGMQPSLIAGVYLRTPNHIYDLSLRKSFTSKHDVLIDELEKLRVGA